MKKKIVALLLCTVMAIGMLSGCGKGETGTPTAAPTGGDADVQPTEQPADATETPAVDPASVTGNLVYWTYTDSANNLVKAFNAVYPNVKIDLQVFGGDEYKTKILTALQSGQDVPDIFDLEENYAYEFLDSDLLENLSYMNIEELTKDFYEFQTAGMKDSKGDFKGVSFQSSPVGYWYLRDAAEKWLGTSDPDEIAAKLQGWDQVVATAKEVYEKSEGKVFLWPNITEMVKVSAFSFDPLVREGKLTIGDQWIGLLDDMRTMLESGYVAELNSWSAEWAAAWNEGALLFRVMPSWDFFTDWESNEGNVGIVTPFAASYEGVTLTSVYSKSENKDAAAYFLQYVLSDDFQKLNMNEYNQVPASKKVADELAEGFASEKFGGQNLLKTYSEICGKIVGITPDKYTRSAQNLFQKYATDGIKAGKDNDTIISDFKKDLSDQYPEVQVD